MYSSFAAYYLEGRNEALRTGAVTYGQMNGVEAV